MEVSINRHPVTQANSMNPGVSHLQNVALNYNIFQNEEDQVKMLNQAIENKELYFITDKCGNKIKNGEAELLFLINKNEIIEESNVQKHNTDETIDQSVEQKCNNNAIIEEEPTVQNSKHIEITEESSSTIVDAQVDKNVRFVNDEKFISCVYKNPVLYDTNHPAFKDAKLKTGIWQEMGQALGLEGENGVEISKLKQKWKSLKDGMIKYFRKPYKNYKWMRYVKQFEPFLPKTQKSTDDSGISSESNDTNEQKSKVKKLKENKKSTKKIKTTEESEKISLKRKMATNENQINAKIKKICECMGSSNGEFLTPNPKTHEEVKQPEKIVLPEQQSSIQLILTNLS